MYTPTEHQPGLLNFVRSKMLCTNGREQHEEKIFDIQLTFFYAEQATQSGQNHHFLFWLFVFDVHNMSTGCIGLD